MPILTTIPLFDFQKHRGCHDRSNNPNQVTWTKEEQLTFIDHVVRSANPNGVLFRTHFSPIIMRKLPNTNTNMWYYNPQRFEVIGDVNCIESLQKFLSSELPIPLSLQDCPIFKNLTPSPFLYQGKKVIGQFSLLPDELRQYFWNIKYPVNIH